MIRKSNDARRLLHYGLRNEARQVHWRDGLRVSILSRPTPHKFELRNTEPHTCNSVHLDCSELRRCEFYPEHALIRYIDFAFPGTCVYSEIGRLIRSFDSKE